MLHVPFIGSKIAANVAKEKMHLERGYVFLTVYNSNSLPSEHDFKWSKRVLYLLQM